MSALIANLWLLLPALPISGQTPTPVAQADLPCAKCHAEIYNEYLKTPTANASGPAADNLKAAALHKTYGPVSYSITAESGKVFLRYNQVAPSIEGSRTLDYYLGSGHLGTTYLYSSNGYLLESPVAYYTGSGLDLKPGITVTGQIASALPVEPACLRCHMSAVQHSDPGSINHYQALPFLHTGITCEACHGDTAAHLASHGKIAAVNPAKLDAPRRDSVCISCHLEGDASVERKGHSSLDYKPGDSISTYLAYFVFAGKSATERGVSEVEQFNLSMCKQKTGEAMSCTSCHNPHSSPTSEQKVEFYRAKCVSCHTNQTFLATHHTENQDCTSCHMAKTGAANIPHVAWTDHRILKQPPASVSYESPTESKELIPLLSPEASARDLALAYYQTSFKAGTALQTKAYDLFRAHETELADDPRALDAFGNIAAARGSLTEAGGHFKAALRSDPTDFNASVNIGTLLARSGELSQAATAWALAFSRNEDIPGLAMNLALAQCRTGQIQAAQTTLQHALQYSPGQKQLSELLAALPACGPSAIRSKEPTR